MLYVVPFIVYFVLDFFTERFLFRRNLKTAFALLGVFVIISLLVYSWYGNQIFRQAEVLFFMPLIYLINAIALRYVLFNKYTTKWALKGEGWPYDPILVKSGMLQTISSSKRRGETWIEFAYSVWIFLFPVLCIIWYLG